MIRRTLSGRRPHPSRRSLVWPSPMTRALVTATLAAALSALTFAQTAAPRPLLEQIDHLVYATPDLDVGINAIETLIGVRATPGGQHPGLGTRNALVALGPASYLEIIGPDPQQPKPAGPRRFGLDDLEAPRLLTWVAKGTNLDALVTRAKAGGVALGSVMPGSRKRPDGVVLSWRYTDPNIALADRLVPFFIDWGSSPHPSATAARGATLVDVRAEHPEPDRAQKMLDALGLGLRVSKGAAARLIATIDGPRGRVVLR
jgi:glyoxalase-like protein